MRWGVGSLSDVVVLTRRSEDNAELGAELHARGLAVVELPCVRTEPLADDRALRTAIASLRPTDLLVLTSRAGVDAVASAGRSLPCDVAVVGHATATAARSAGLRVTFVASRSDSATLGHELPLPVDDVVLARSDLAEAGLPSTLCARGARVRELVAYRTIGEVSGDRAAAREAIAGGATVVVASPSAVRALRDELGVQLLTSATFVAIGPTTARAVRELLEVEPRVAAGTDARSVVEAIAHAPQEVRT
jgi:uroporphyrinogen-III synthase